MNIYSKIDPTLLLHIIQRRKDVQPGRADLIPADQFLQMSTIRVPKGTTYKPHHHIEQHRDEPNWIAQEAWIICSGVVGITLYDIDNTIIHTDVLEAGDCSCTMRGGHTYQHLSDDCLVYEVKTGPYLGQEKDKIFI